MINKDSNKETNNRTDTTYPVPETGYVDAAKIGVQCHFLIKDVKTGEVLVNKRG